MSQSLGVAAAFSEGDSTLMKRALVDPYAEKHRAPLIPNFSEIKSAALESGALGCSFSGAGPTLFALTDSRETAKSCLEAMKSVCSDTPRMTHIGAIAKKGARAK